MDAFKVSKRKRGEDTDGKKANRPDQEGASQKRVCRAIKDEPNEDHSIPLRSLPVHSTAKYSAKEEEEEQPEREVPGAGLESLLTPPPTLPSSSSNQQPAPLASPPSPTPLYWQPYFPDQAIRCNKCHKTNSVSRKPTVQSNVLNAGRFYFYCWECSGYNCFGGFICWDDTRGIHEDNEKCECHLPSRADLMRCRPHHIFFTCALGRCGFHERTFEYLEDKAELDDRVKELVSYAETIIYNCLTRY
ncbi:hypothetical protein PG987_003821 [Apiospora arundinis]